MLNRTNTLFPVFLLFILGSLQAGSQNIVDPQKSNEEIFLARTKQLNEFIDRFNLVIDFRGNAVDSAFVSRMPREKMLAALFNLKDARATGNNREYNLLKGSFIKEVNSKKLYINKFSPGIIAEARARVIYETRPLTISLFLSQETTDGGGVKWVLLGAAGEPFDIFREDTSMVRFIPPASHETNFINLRRALEDSEHLGDYAYAEFDPDFLTLFFFCINKGIIKYEHVENVIYHIIDIPGWYIRVEEFNRNEFNSGWLISDLQKNQLNQEEFLKMMF